VGYDGAMELSQLREVLEAASYLVTILGVPGAVYLFWSELRRQRREREHAAYNALADKYTEYIKMCIDDPELDVFEWSSEGSGVDRVERRQLMLLTYLIAVFERAYFMYRDQSERFRQKQWSGWEAYIDEWCARPQFRRAWGHYGQMFDTEFSAYLDGRVRSAQAQAQAQGPARAGAPAG
jgi:hypothetical protein